MANLWRGCACTILYPKAPMGEGHSTVTPKDEGAQRRVLHNTVRRAERKEKKLLPLLLLINLTDKPGEDQRTSHTVN